MLLGQTVAARGAFGIRQLGVGVGTVLFNMAVNPVNGHLYVSNTEARNEVRFEGPGLAFDSTTVQGHLHEARITVLDGATVTPRHLNKHIDYDVVPSPAGVKDDSLAIPTSAHRCAGTSSKCRAQEWGVILDCGLDR